MIDLISFAVNAPVKEDRSRDRPLAVDPELRESTRASYSCCIEKCPEGGLEGGLRKSSARRALDGA